MNASYVKRSLNAALLVTFGFGCSVEDTQSAAQALSVEELGARLDQGTTRLEIELENGLEAREIEVYPDSELVDEEYAESILVSLDPAGQLVLELGQLAVTFDDATRFRTPEESHVARDAWISEVAARLAAGQATYVRASRPPSSDTSFHATDLRLEEQVDENKLELNVDRGDLVVASQSQGTLSVMGLAVSISPATQIFTSAQETSGSDDGPLHD